MHDRSESPQFITRETVVRAAEHDFPNADVAEILEILDRYGLESCEPERDRVQLDILKLSEGRLDRLEAQVEMAKVDYRDVIVAAEY
jgi:hypothetical protein